MIKPRLMMMISILFLPKPASDLTPTAELIFM